MLAATINKEVTCIPIESGVEARRQRLDVEVGKGGMTILTGDVRNYARMIIETDAGRPAKSRNTFDNFVRFDPFIQQCEMLTAGRKQTSPRRKPSRKRTSTHVCRRMSCWTNSTNASRTIGTGRCLHYDKN